MQLELIGLLIFMSLMLTYLVHAELYFRKLAQFAPDLYIELGSPSVIGKRQNALPVLLFFARGEYKELEDKPLVRMGKRLVGHFLLTLLCMVAFFGYLLWLG